MLILQLVALILIDIKWKNIYFKINIKHYWTKTVWCFFFKLYWTHCYFQENSLLTSHSYRGDGFSGAHVIAGHTPVGAAIGHFELGDCQLAVLSGLGPRGKGSPARAGPAVGDWVGAVGDALQAQGFTSTSDNLVRDWRSVGRGFGARQSTWTINPLEVWAEKTFIFLPFSSSEIF